MTFKQFSVIAFLLAGKTLSYRFPNFPNFPGQKGNSQNSGIQKPFDIDIADKCFKAPPCDPNQKFRNYDGSCNNLLVPVWGMADTAFIRILEPRYSDGLHKPPKSVTGEYLRNARNIRLALFPDKNVPHELNTIVLMQWGQFVAHDTALSKPQSLSDDCCPKEYETDKCYPILISKDDPFYSKFNQTCMNLVRTETTKKLKCNTKGAQQINANTHFVDASLIYGSDEKTAKQLRGTYGLLKTQSLNGGYFPPNDENPAISCDRSQVCFKAGDIRVNQNPQMTVLQVLFLREHNRVATTLKYLNPKWDDETLYQESKRIVTAIIQHITYHNWLPYIMGEKVMKKYNLYPAKEGYSKDYDEKLNPSTMNEFTTAAYRYFHSLIQGELKFYKSGNETYGQILLGEWFNRPSILTEKFDSLTQGMAFQPCQKGDIYYTTQITNYLFKESKEFGQDLEAIDIQRGREHGLASYNSAREYCKLKKVNSFDELSKYMGYEIVKLLKQYYRHVNDIDLFTGLSLEPHVPGSMIGPTGLCILIEQFRRWKAGDRWFYDLEKNPYKFTQGQLRELKKATLSRVVCDNGDNIKEIQENIWEQISYRNPLKSCNDVEVVNLDLWKESEESYD